jgi:plastocyanin
MIRTVFAACSAVAILVGLSRLGAVAQNAPTAAASPAAVVHIKDFAFSPSTVTVKTGDTVHFVNDDSVPHTVTSSDKSFDSGNMNQGSAWNYTFAKAGTYAYTCTFHPYMKGTVTVKDATSTTGS